MQCKAFAKINLALDVFNIREDGYHDLKSIMVPIYFYDDIEIEKFFVDTMECNLSFLKYDENNSVYKMISLFREKYGILDHFKVKLHKRIPTQAGLGGGTADAAAALKLLCRMYHIFPSEEDVKEMCVNVGADVYFNYYNKPAIVEGIGDIITPIDIKGDYYLLLVKPKYGISTKEAFDKLDMNTCDHPDIDRLKKALQNEEDIDGLLGNSLEQPSILLNKDIQIIKDTFKENNIHNVLMSGSGSTVFGISKNKQELDALYPVFKSMGYFVRSSLVMTKNGKSRTTINNL